MTIKEGELRLSLFFVKKNKKIYQYVLTFTAKGGNIKSSRKAQKKRRTTK